MKTIAIAAAVLPLLAIPASAGNPANKASDKPEASQRKVGVITAESRRAAWDLMMHRNIKQPPTAPKAMHCHISSTGHWVSCF